MHHTIAAAVLLLAPVLSAYSVLTHQAIIDSAWDQNISPVLLKRFPGATPEDLEKAHAYAYGGCIIQDLGYYPFGNRFYSDLVHYVRSGDFVIHLIGDSQDLDEYAFALGALAHYAADNDGHAIGVNPSVAILFPKLRRKYGKVVTYEDNPAAHLKVEFGFDVLQVSRGNYAPQSYHDFIGFQVSKPLLERAFRDTYDLELKDVLSNMDLALGTYRRAVSMLIPKMTRVAWDLAREKLRTAHAGLTRREFVYKLSKASYRKEWGKDYRGPGLGARILALWLRFMPKIGPFKFAAIKTPTPQTASLFEDSFVKTLSLYQQLLADTGRDQPRLPNRDFDTGRLTQPGEYRMADDAYAKLAVTLADRMPDSTDPQLRANILAYYRNLDLPFATKKNAKKWRQTIAALNRLKAAPPASSSLLPAPGTAR